MKAFEQNNKTEKTVVFSILMQNKIVGIEIESVDRTSYQMNMKSFKLNKFSLPISQRRVSWQPNESCFMVILPFFDNHLLF